MSEERTEIITQRAPTASHAVEQNNSISSTSTENKLTTENAHYASNEGLLNLETKKRDKTWGEKRFNLVTYGGWALLGNEAVSLAITESVKKNADGSPRIANGLYTKFENLFKKSEPFLKNNKFLQSLGDYVAGSGERKLTPRLPYLLVATIGGMLVVPFVKKREDNKGEIVRKLDLKHYGDRSEKDSKLIEAHKEMDDAPKQSWSSLWKGRIATVAAAAIADFSFGWPDALTTKLFKGNSTYQKYASLERISDVVADKVSTQAEKTFNLSEGAKNHWKKVAGNGTWLLTLSTSLTVLFYASSKLFAKKRDEKIERRYNELHNSAEAPAATSELPQETASPKVEERPKPQVNGIQLDHKLQTQPQLAATL